MNQIKKKKDVLVVVAHPDDETLWFYGGLNQISKRYNVDVLSLTYSANSLRAKEVMAATAGLPVNLYFGGLKDQGISSALNGVEESVAEFLKKKNYSILITHPPHGGEKPHPHHLQCFHVVRRMSFIKGVRFGFFSEIPVKPSLDQGSALRFSLVDELAQTFDYVRLLLKHGRYPLKTVRAATKEFDFLIKRILVRPKFYFFKFKPDIVLKRKSLMCFRSQIRSLVDYRAFSGSTEYLYIQKS